MGGLPLVAQGALTPEIWPRATLEVLDVASVFGVVAGLRIGGYLSHSLRAWAVLVVPYAAGLVALGTAIMVGSGVVLGDGLLQTGVQRVAFGVAAAGAIATIAHLTWSGRHGFPPRPDPDRDARREAIRENVRREIEEIERQARTARETPPTS